MDGSDPGSVQMEDPNARNLVAEVSLREPVVYNPVGDIRIVAVDCGIKFNQIRCLCERGASVKVVPWNYKLNSDGKAPMMLQNLRRIVLSTKKKKTKLTVLGHSLLQNTMACS